MSSVFTNVHAQQPASTMQGSSTLLMAGVHAQGHQSIAGWCDLRELTDQLFLYM